MHDAGAIQRAHAVERPERVHAAEGLLARENNFANGGSQRGVAALDEETLGGFAPPRVGMREALDPLRGGERGSGWGAGHGAVDGHDAVNAAEVLRIGQLAIFALFAEVAGERDAVLQNAAIKIDDVQRAVGPGAETNGAESFVGGGDKFFLIVGVTTLDRAVFGGEKVAADKIRRGFGDKRIAIKFRQEIAAINPRGVGGGEFFEFTVAQKIGAITTVDAGIHAGGPDEEIVGGVNVGAGETQKIRITLEVVGRDDVDAQGVAVGAVEETAVVILAQAPLAAEERGGGFPFAVHVAKFFRVGGAVNPVVVRPEQVVGRALGVG